MTSFGKKGEKKVSTDSDQRNFFLRTYQPQGTSPYYFNCNMVAGCSCEQPCDEDGPEEHTNWVTDTGGRCWSPFVEVPGRKLLWPVWFSPQLLELLIHARNPSPRIRISRFLLVMLSGYLVGTCC